MFGTPIQVPRAHFVKQNNVPLEFKTNFDSLLLIYQTVIENAQKTSTCT